MSPPSSAPQGKFVLGTAAGPGKPTIGVTSQALLRDGRPWLGVMGEIHYTRVAPEQWRESLLRMKAGGLDVVACYIFWIHHEEIEGQFKWAGQHDLRRFVEICGEVGLPVILRCGPWCHGEVRNGGLPDWIVRRGEQEGFETRSLDERFMLPTRKLYDQIAKQVTGQLWKDGGPVVGVQVDNEYGGPGEYLMALRDIAIECGLDVPIYTRTGWPTPKTPIPFGYLLPLYGAYAEGFWSRELEAMPGHYWKAFCFEIVRTDVEVGADMLGKREATNEPDTAQYPYLTCEIGGGMEQSYHRRVKIFPQDIYSVTVTKLGSGSNLPGYYMYHGGRNPPGELSTLQESQATKYHNDSPTLNYDFQAPLGQWGQVRPHYHLLRRAHYFMSDFGAELAGMRVSLPKEQPTTKTDTHTLRWAHRGDDTGAGFVFINNYQRLMPMPAKEDVRLTINTQRGDITLPSEPVTIPGDVSLFWPVNLKTAAGRLIHATAQPMSRIRHEGGEVVVFFAAAGLEAEFAFEKHPQIQLDAPGAQLHSTPDSLIVRRVKPADEPVIRLASPSGKTDIYLISEDDAGACWRVTYAGKQRLLVASVDAVIERQGRLRLISRRSGAVPIRFIPSSDCPPSVAIEATSLQLEVTKIKDAGPLRKIALGYHKVAEAPTDSDFDAAAVYRVTIPRSVDRTKSLISIQYVGDVARLYAGSRLLNDHFYNGGLPLETALADVTDDELELRILPLQKDAPIYLSPDAKPEFAGKTAVELINSACIVAEGEAFL